MMEKTTAARHDATLTMATNLHHSSDPHTDSIMRAAVTTQNMSTNTLFSGIGSTMTSHDFLSMTQHVDEKKKRNRQTASKLVSISPPVMGVQRCTDGGKSLHISDICMSACAVAEHESSYLLAGRDGKGAVYRAVEAKQ